MDTITKPQIIRVHKLLAVTASMPYKEYIIKGAVSDGREIESTKELTYTEAEKLIDYLQNLSRKCDELRKKVISHCMECGMIINGRSDMPVIYEWVLQYGHAVDSKGNKKKMNQYSYDELLKLVTQAQLMRDKFIREVRK